ncbi:uncharacterized protein J7T55_000456 [Diaporthe amygdali]|uniref:uncharacterized protein n=1 Tax=Phomopsis amygdali TaxID=1214568 RepID=UPI0022FE5E09|nr:uncharacterized protein J7T55_000456 [Diaporthe amygdali]KAJ0103829.1 uncharacterized protein J7T55_000456 [Diaporthe amygdali]
MTSPETMPERWAAAWSNNDSAAFAKLFAPQAVYTDHAYQLIITKIENHHRGWRRANPNFKAILDPSTPIWWAKDHSENDRKMSCSFRTIMTGTFSESLPSKPASGKDWCFSAMVHLAMEDGLITRCDEFYRDSFDMGVPIRTLGFNMEEIVLKRIWRGANFCMAIFIKVYYMRRNAQRDKIWNAMSADEKDHYLATTTDEGNKRLDFRFAH